ncbi:NAD(P)H-hydrate dehydratase [Roseivirga sp.]|uniref:NAD(P)H-hydrate dehydratase n=1 Tax=Roseivirga sp. TaxID=1964215 RepID=UPI002B27BB6C|nr:NAD(P)H-hydrate dehydratase [Roseivirga sp.]
MIKILSAEQIRRWDLFTIKNEPISSIDLMERASSAFVKLLLTKVKGQPRVDVVCGPGNNGGDGFAIARLLIGNGLKVNCHLIDFGLKLSEDCRKSYRRFLDISQVNIVKQAKDLSLNGEIVIDAMFGSGLNRSATGLAAEVIQLINQSQSKTIAVDMPSGLFADKVNLSGKIIEADWTITFQAPKLSFLIPESGYYVGEWSAVDIGLNPDFLKTESTDFFIFEKSDIDHSLFDRKKFDHKGKYGRVLIVAGSLGKIGAAYLSSKAALKSGAGLLTVHIPQVGYAPIQTSLPEAMVSVDPEQEFVSEINKVEGFDVIGIGPGLGDNPKTGKIIKELFTSFNKPMAIDADALNLIALDKELIDLVPKGSVLTPHIGEFNRLFGECDNGLERIEKIRTIAIEKQLIIVLKGAHSVVATPDGEIYFNSTGNSGMATAGCGDVLTGIISALMARGSDSSTSARVGVCIHGWAGDLAENTVGKTALMASDLLCALPEVFSNVESSDFI